MYFNAKKIKYNKITIKTSLNNCCKQRSQMFNSRIKVVKNTTVWGNNINRNNLKENNTIDICYLALFYE